MKGSLNMKIILKSATLLVALALGLGSAQASVSPGVILGSTLFPPESDPVDCDNLISVYAAPGQHMMFMTESGPLLIIDPVLKCFRNVERFNIDPMTEGQRFDARLEGVIEFSSTLSPDKTTRTDLELEGDVEMTSRRYGPSNPAYEVVIQSLSLSGQVDGLDVQLVVDPARPSMGQTVWEDLGDGQYMFVSSIDLYGGLVLDGEPLLAADDAVSMVLMYANDPLPVHRRSTWSSLKSLYR